ncbi:hypothetical protein V6N12_065671 [Hibiscus sabdariffa]|uniref:Integrase catalytic domain-containing protein n=1 Tax=Hibiscus sabdariffa TaxID=183260 RepID=A0ABR2G9D4_9ROSI
MTKTPFNGKGERASDLLGLIHSDVCGPMNTQARGGFHYFITFTDDFSRYGYIYRMRHKSEALEKFKEFRNEVQNEHGKSIKALRSDQGGEYLSHEFDELLKECGIVSQLTPPGTPQWNGVSERRNRTLLDMVRSMMSHSDLPISFWGHALKATAFTLNRVPSKSVQKTPHEMWTGKRPKDRRNIELEEVEQQQDTEPEVERFSQTIEENSTDLETRPLRRSTRERHEPERYGFLVTTHGDVILVDHDEPKTYQEAVSSLDSEKWLEAMRSEMDSMSDNQVWTLVEPPEGIKPIGCKWVFKKKTDMDGNVQTYKGRLVAKGYRQIHGIDYDETFSPVAMFKCIRILLAIAAFHDYEIWQMDVKTAFLNGKLKEYVYCFLRLRRISRRGQKMEQQIKTRLGAVLKQSRLITFRTRQGSNYDICRNRVGEPATVELSRIRHISCQSRFTRPGRRFRRHRGQAIFRRHRGQETFCQGSRFSRPRRGQVIFRRHCEAGDFPANSRISRREQNFPPRQEISRRGDSFSAEGYCVQARQAVTGLRDKPMTQHDALPNSKVPAEISARAGPVASLPRHPLCHPVKADC